MQYEYECLIRWYSKNFRGLLWVELCPPTTLPSSPQNVSIRETGEVRMELIWQTQSAPGSCN